MNNERHGLFADLTPPPGGAERFAKRLDETAHAEAPRWRRFAFAGAACAAVALVVAVVLLREPSDSASSTVAAAPVIYDAPEFDRLLGRPSRPTELMVTRNAQAAVVAQVETTNEKIRIYDLD